MGVGLGVVCVIVWLLLSGYFDNGLLLTLGGISCLIAVWIAYRMRLFDQDQPSLMLVWRSVLYLPWLFWEIIKANIDVVKRILDPALPISPTLFRVKAQQRSDLAKVIYANSITLTPGTVSIIVDGDEIEVHALTEEAAEALKEGEMGRRVARLEGTS